MKKWLLVTTLAASMVGGAAMANPQLNKYKQEFNAKSQRFAQALNGSIAKMNQKQQQINQSKKTLQGFRNPKNSALENQCLNAMLHRANNTSALVRNMITRMNAAQKQLPNIRQRGQRAQNVQQLDQSARQINQIIDQLNVMGNRNNQTAKQLTANVDKICSRLPK